MKVAPVERTFTLDDNRRASVTHQGEFYKPGESRPFETVIGYQTFDVEDSPRESRTAYGVLDIEFDHSTTSPQEEIEDISRKMGDPKTNEAERNALLVRMVEVQRKMLENMTKAVQTDPASLNKAQDDFGCGLMQLYPSKGGSGRRHHLLRKELQWRRTEGHRHDDAAAVVRAPRPVVPS